MSVIAKEKSDVKRSQVAAVSGSGDLIATKKGELVYSMTRLSADDRERLALARNPKFRAIIEASRQSLRTDGGLTMEEICQEFGLKNPARKTRPQRKKLGVAKVKN